MKPAFSLNLPRNNFETYLYFHPFEKAESQKQGLSAAKIVLHKRASSSTHLAGVLLFSSKSNFQKLNQIQR